MNKVRPFIGDETILKDPNQAYFLDCTWGFIRRFEGNKHPNKYAHNFHGIIYKIEQLKKIFSDQKEYLNTLSRRIAYLKTLEEELKYLSERYQWNKIESLYEVFLSKFEQFVTQTAELMMYTIHFYQQKKSNYKGIEVCKFEDVGDFLCDENSGLPDYFRSINDSLTYSILIFIRNSLTHDFSKITIIANNQNPIISVKNIPNKKRYGVFKPYLEYIYSLYTGEKHASKYVKLIDPRFPYLKMKLKLTRNCKLDLDNSVVSFSMSSLDFANMIWNDLFILQRDSFSVLLNENNIS